MSLIFFMSKLFQHSLWYCCSLFWLSKYSLGNFSHWNVFDSVMEHFRISLYEWWNIFDRKKWCRKFSVENFAVENFPSLTVEHFPLLMNPFVENFLSKVVCFPKNSYPHLWCRGVLATYFMSLYLNWFYCSTSANK